MNKIILLLLFTISIYSQERKLIMPEKLYPYFEEFIEDGKDNGISTIFLDVCSSVDYIFIYVPKEIKDIGFYDQINRVIAIRPDAFYDSYMVRFVLYHEIGHALGLEHSCDNCDDVMTSSISDKFIQKNKDKPRHWKRMTKRFWKKYKKLKG